MMTFREYICEGSLESKRRAAEAAGFVLLGEYDDGEDNYDDYDDNALGEHDGDSE